VFMKPLMVPKFTYFCDKLGLVSAWGGVLGFQSWHSLLLLLYIVICDWWYLLVIFHRAASSPHRSWGSE
jgi:hypothetical protein